MMTPKISIVRDVAGAATIELALVAPMLGAMLIGMIDLSTAYSNKLQLEQIAQRVIENVQQNGTTADKKTALETEAQAAAGTGSVAVATFRLECNGVATTYANGCTGGQAYARFVELVITKSHTPLIPAKFAASNTDGTITVRGIAGIRIQ